QTPSGHITNSHWLEALFPSDRQEDDPGIDRIHIHAVSKMVRTVLSKPFLDDGQLFRSCPGPDAAFFRHQHFDWRVVRVAENCLRAGQHQFTLARGFCGRTQGGLKLRFPHENAGSPSVPTRSEYRQKVTIGAAGWPSVSRSR